MYYVQSNNDVLRGDTSLPTKDIHDLSDTLIELSRLVRRLGMMHTEGLKGRYRLC